MAVLPTGIGPVTGYNIERSLRFNSADSAGLNRTAGTQTSNSAWTYSVWLKRGLISNAANLYVMRAQNPGNTLSTELFFAATNDTLVFREYGPSAYTSYLQTTQVFRDPSAWYHIVLAYNPANSTSSDKVRLYVNGVRITTFSTATYPSSTSQATAWNTSGNPQYIGSTNTSTFDGYMTEINFIDGQGNLTQNDFGETDSATGVWKPKKYGGTYGNNGFFLKFADNSGTTSTTLGKDSSGNGNNWTPNNFSVTAGVGNDSLVDSPTSYGGDTGAGGEVRGNYATLNPLKRFTANATLSNGNLTASDGSTTSTSIIATMSLPASGKWYWEITISASVSGGIFIGACPEANAYGTAVVQTNGSYRNNGTIYNTASVTQTSGATYTTNDVIGVAVDVDNGTVQFYKNGTAQGATPSFSFTALSVLVPFIATDNAAGTKTVNCNFGQRAFEKWNGSAFVANTAPSGFKALCTQNLPPVTIGATSTTQANDYFNAVIWTGDGNNPRTVSGVGFQPDFVWSKLRSAAASHNLYDAVRGVGNVLYSDLTAQEANNNVFGYLSAFNSDGFVASAGSTSNAYFNTLNSTYVAWNWKANGAGSTNTAGTITSTVSANTTSGFSIVTYTGTGTAGTIGHGLGAAPQMIIVKNRNTSSYAWFVWHTAFGAAGNTDYIALNLSDAKGSGGAVSMWNTTMPTSSVFSIGTYGGVNGNTNTYVVYCFAPVAGYSAFGSYTGNGSADGPFVYTGFRPRFVLLKSSSLAGSFWNIVDTARNSYNVINTQLYPNSSAAEGTVSVVDTLSNGFKIRTTNTDFNSNTNTYIYAAFAESPFKYSLAR